MKQAFCVLIVIFLISGYLASSLLRVKKNSKSKKSKTKGADNTENGGFQCDIKVDGKKSGSGYFFAKKLLTPVSSDEKLGWTFIMTAGPEGVLKDIMSKGEATGSQYFPFRNIVGTATYTNPFGDNKNISFKVSLDDKRSFVVKVDLPYKLIGWYVNDNQGTSYANALTNWSNVHRSALTQSKTAAINAATVYQLKKPLLDAANGKGADLKSRLQTVAEQQKLLEENIKTLQKQRDDAQKAFIEAQNTVNNLKSQFGPLNSDLSSLETRNNEIGVTLEGLKGKTTATSKEIEKFKTSTDASLKEWETHLSKLKELAPEKVAVASAMNEELIKLNSNGVTENMKKIKPL